MARPEMSDYERQAWEDLVRRRDRFLSRRARRLLPEPVRRRVTETGRAAADKAQQLPGAGQVQRLVAGVAKGATEGVSRAALRSLNSDKVVQAFRERDHPVDVIADIRALNLRDVDTIRPRLDGKYMAAAGGPVLELGSKFPAARFWRCWEPPPGAPQEPRRGRLAPHRVREQVRRLALRQ